MPAATGSLDHHSAEFRLAYLCCSNRVPDAGLLPLLAQIEVAAFLQLVIERHRIGPLVAARLHSLPADAVPPALRTGLDAELQRNRLRNLKAIRSHLLLDRGFGQAGIPWLPFKGLTLASRYYGDIDARQVNDLDLWVPLAQLDAARTVLAGLGFRFDASSAHWDLATRGPQHRDFLCRWQVEETHVSREHGGIDLHWQLSDNPALFRLSADELLAGRETLHIGGQPLPVMRHEDLLLYLCEHGGKHGWFRLKWLADLPRVIDHRPLDWQRLFARARQLGSERSLLLGLALTEQLFQWPPPAEVAIRLAQFRRRRTLLRIVGALLQDPAEGLAQKITTWRWVLLTAAARLLLSGQWQALRHSLWRLSLSPPDLRMLSLPDRCLPLYRLLRPALLVWRRSRQQWPSR